MLNNIPHVYFVQESGHRKLIKIGCTTQGELRLQTVKLWCPYPITLLAMMKGSKELEAWFHVQFSEYRTHGEWFLPHKKIFDAIEEINSNKTLKNLPILASSLNYKTKSNLPAIIKKFNMPMRKLAKEVGLSSSSMRGGLTSRDYNDHIFNGGILSPRSIHLIIEYGKKVGVKLSYEDFYKPLKKSKAVSHA